MFRDNRCRLYGDNIYARQGQLTNFTVAETAARRLQDLIGNETTLVDPYSVFTGAKRSVSLENS